MICKGFYSVVILLALPILSCKKKTEEIIAPQAEPKISYLHSYALVDSTQASTYATLQIFQPELAPLLKKAKHSTNNYKIFYNTLYKGKKIVASGLISLPKGSTHWPILSFHHGTIFDNAIAPSNSNYEKLVTGAMASVGFITLSPDYIGFGSSLGIVHPYYVSEYSARTVRDLIEAAKELLIVLNVNHNGQLFMSGYSQGGNVTMAAAKSIEKEPIVSLELTASAVGAGGYNLIGIFNEISAKDSFPSPNYIAYIIQSFRTTYGWNTPLNYFFQEPYATRIPDLIDGTTSSGVVNSQLTIKLDTLLQPNFVKAVQQGTDTKFIAALNTNSLYDWKPAKPIRFYHGTSDEIVPYTDSENTFKYMQQLGANNVSFVSLPGKNHETGVVPMLLDVFDWFNSYLQKL